MYLTIKQHDMFRTLLMGFEIPYRAYIADVITSRYVNDESFEQSMISQNTQISHSSPQFLRDTLPKAVSNHTLRATYQKFVTAKTSVDEIVTADIDIPMVGALNLVSFALTECFSDLYSVFNDYSAFCDLAEKLGLEVPVSSAIYEAVYTDITPQQVLSKLMNRKLKKEECYD